MSKKQKVVGECKLCQNRAELRESHIVSKFLLKESGIIGHKKSFSLPCLNHPELSERHRQDGFKESLLCTDCETKRLAPLEGYARQQFYGTNSPLMCAPSTGFFWTGLDYAKMKLFSVSIVWRMSLSTHPYYRRVQLGPKHEERMRKMLLEMNPREPWRYGCTIGLLLLGNKPLTGGVFSQPHRHSRTENRYIYRFMMAKFVWYFYVASHATDIRNKGFIQPDGVWPVPAVEAERIPFIKSEFDRYRRSHQT